MFINSKFFFTVNIYTIDWLSACLSTVATMDFEVEMITIELSQLPV